MALTCLGHDPNVSLKGGAMTISTAVELYWQGSSSFGHEGKISGVDLRVEGLAEAIYVAVDPDQSIQRLTLKVDQQVYEGVELPSELLRTLKVFARVFQPDGTRVDHPVPFSEIPDFALATYQLRIVNLGHSLTATYERTRQIGSLTDNLMRYGRMSKLASDPSSEWNQVKTVDLMKQLKDAQKRYEKAFVQNSDGGIEKDAIEEEILSMRIALLQRNVPAGSLNYNECTIS